MSLLQVQTSYKYKSRISSNPGLESLGASVIKLRSYNIKFIRENLNGRGLEYLNGVSS